MVNIGLQQITDPLVIKLREPERRRRSATLRMMATVTIPDQPEPVNYLQLKPLLREYCISCHNASSYEEGLNGGLDLGRFPFRSISDRYENQKQIVDDMIYSMGNDTEPMPPEPPFVPFEDIDRFQEWVDAGLPARPGGANNTRDLIASGTVTYQLVGGEETGEVLLARDANGDLVGTLPDAVVSSAYTLTYVIKAKDGRETHTGSTAVTVATSGDVEWQVEIPYEDPEIDIPIIIEP